MGRGISRRDIVLEPMSGEPDLGGDVGRGEDEDDGGEVGDEESGGEKEEFHSYPLFYREAGRLVRCSLEKNSSILGRTPWEILGEGIVGL